MGGCALRGGCDSQSGQSGQGRIRGRTAQEVLRFLTRPGARFHQPARSCPSTDGRDLRPRLPGAGVRQAKYCEPCLESAMSNPLSPDLLRKMHAYWRAANYLSVGQIYLQDNPLLATPLTLEHVKPRLLGHWGTTTRLNFLYVHLNRLIKDNDLSMIYVVGPGHGGPGIVAHSYLEGSYTEHYPAIERSRNGLQRLFRQFSWPYGVPSHV